MALKKIAAVLILPPTILLAIEILAVLDDWGTRGVPVLTFSVWFPLLWMGVALYSFVSLWVLTSRISKKGEAYIGPMLIGGLLMTPCYGCWKLYQYFSGDLGVYEQVFYFPLAPSVYAFICLYILRKPTLLPSFVSYKIRLSAIGRLLTWVSNIGFFIVFFFVTTSMLGTFLSRGYGGVEGLISPLNWINWSMIVVLCLPAILLRQLALRKFSL